MFQDLAAAGPLFATQPIGISSGSVCLSCALCLDVFRVAGAKGRVGNVNRMNSRLLDWALHCCAKKGAHTPARPASLQPVHQLERRTYASARKASPYAEIERSYVFPSHLCSSTPHPPITPPRLCVVRLPFP